MWAHLDQKIIVSLMQCKALDMDLELIGQFQEIAEFELPQIKWVEYHRSKL